MTPVKRAGRHDVDYRGQRVPALSQTRTARAEVLIQVEKLQEVHPLHLTSFPAVDARAEARVLTEVKGKNFPAAGYLGFYAGLAPVTLKSGTSGRGHNSSRMGNRNDGAHVEQKNWARVRELVGYYRYDTPGELIKINEIFVLDAVFTDYFLPQQKLIFKQRHGAKVTKKHDTATTPDQRAITHPTMRKRPIMNAVFKLIEPATLSREILALTAQLKVLSQAKKAPGPHLRSTTPGTTAGKGNQMRQPHSLTGCIDVRQQASSGSGANPLR